LSAQACPRLVPLIESAEPFGQATTGAVREYAQPLRDAGVDTVILGCTHYPLIRRIFEREFGRDVTLVFSADETAREVAETLQRKGIENDPARDGSCRFLTTGDPEGFQRLGERFLQLPIASSRTRTARRSSPSGGRVCSARRRSTKGCHVGSSAAAADG
jgi:glutamate racemase